MKFEKIDAMKKNRVPTNSTKKIKDDSFKGCLGPTLSFVALLLGMAPLGLFHWLSKMGIKQHHLPQVFFKSDAGTFVLIGIFLLILAILLAFSAKSEKMFRIASWTLVVLAVMNLGGCMAMWQGFNGAFG